MTDKFTSSKGIAASISASIFFALMPLYLQFIPTVSGYAATGQRIIWTSIFITFILLAKKQLVSALSPLAKPKNWPNLMAGSILVGVQWFIFVWAPLNGETLGLSLGYFLLPLALVFVGRFLLAEPLSPAQKLASLFAIAAVTYSLIKTGSFSWVALVICIGYPIYFMLRRKYPLPVLSAFYIENILLLPVAWWSCQYFGQVNSPFDYSPINLLWFFGLGILGSLGMLSMLYASRTLPISLFGLLGYLEPPLIMLTGVLLLNETIHADEMPTYTLIGLALLILIIDGIRKVNKSIRRTSG